MWFANADPLPAFVIDVVRHASKRDGVFVSTISAWEIGLLRRPRPNRLAVPQFRPDPKTWFSNFLAQPGVREASLTAAIAIDSSHLPGDFHADPMDRLIVTTARHIGAPEVTRDTKIIAYAEAGYIDVIRC